MDSDTRDRCHFSEKPNPYSFGKKTKHNGFTIGNYYSVIFFFLWLIVLLQIIGWFESFVLWPHICLWINMSSLYTSPKSSPTLDPWTPLTSPGTGRKLRNRRMRHRWVLSYVRWVVHTTKIKRKKNESFVGF